jgi:malonyl-CoA O-methyltransferase
MTRRPASTAPPDFAVRVRRAFGRRANGYERHARLQRAIAWRLAGLCRPLPLAAGPRADLGAGSGLLSRALLDRWPGLAEPPPLQLDHCAELLERNPLAAAAGGLLWDLDRGLPAGLRQASLLASSFALQWLADPPQRLREWAESLAPAGWLVLAVPCSGSFPQWRHAAAAAEVPCTALDLPVAAELIAAAGEAGLDPAVARVLRFSRVRQGGRDTLRQLGGLGAVASRRPPLAPGQLRRLLRHWPDSAPLTWEVLVLIAQRSRTAGCG